MHTHPEMYMQNLVFWTVLGAKHLQIKCKKIAEKMSLQTWGKLKFIETIIQIVLD